MFNSISEIMFILDLFDIKKEEDKAMGISECPNVPSYRVPTMSNCTPVGYVGQSTNLAQRVMPDSIPVPDTIPKVIAQGWECPKCGRVMAPFKECCVYCGNNG